MMVDHNDIRAAADFADSVHRRNAKAEYEQKGLSSLAVAELLEKRFLQPAALFDRERRDSLTEDYMQRQLSPSTFSEIKALRGK